MLLSSVPCYAAGSDYVTDYKGAMLPKDTCDSCHIIVNDYYDGENHIRIDKIYTDENDMCWASDGLQFSALKCLDGYFYDGNGTIKKDRRKAVSITSSLGENDYFDTVRFDYFTSNEVEITYTYEKSDCVITVENEFKSVDYEIGRIYYDKVLPVEYYSFKEGETYEINAIAPQGTPDGGGGEEQPVEVSTDDYLKADELNYVFPDFIKSSTDGREMFVLYGNQDLFQQKHLQQVKPYFQVYRINQRQPVNPNLQSKFLAVKGLTGFCG